MRVGGYVVSSPGSKPTGEVGETRAPWMTNTTKHRDVEPVFLRTGKADLTERRFK